MTTRKNRKHSKNIKESPIPFSSLVFALAVAADGHVPTVAGVLGVTAGAVSARLSRSATRSRWFHWRRQRSAVELRAIWLRRWWRARMRAIGVDPATLPVTDPAWSACHRFPRGHLVRVVALLMRLEHPGESLATEERIGELLARVAELHARGPVAVAEVSRALGMLP